jgi:cell wall-associated NlpC family hydrolase
MRTLAAVVVLSFLVLAPASTAAVGGYAEVIGANGHVLAAGTGPSFDYPAGGALVHIPRAVLRSGGVELDQVSLLGGTIGVAEIRLPRGRNAIQIDGLTGGAQALPTTPDALVTLGSRGYMVVAQQAVVPQAGVGRVGLRVVLQADGFGARAGTQVLVGLPYAPAPSRSLAAVRSDRSPLAVLGLAASAAAPAFVPAPVGTAEIGSGGGTLGARAVALAVQFLGVPYRWGGADPLTGFDCSGLALYVYAQLGIPLTHYTGSQYHEGMPVPPGELEPGDLVFFDASAAGPQHEGIYIGGGHFVQAPHTGDVVKISSLDDPAYGLRYVGAVRPSVP